MEKTYFREPLVSVITPNYNGENYIIRCIESVKRQSISLEHIVVDDCSSDCSWDLLLTLAEKNSFLKPHRLKKNSGPAAARNQAIRLARGRFIAFLDVDDLWLPHKLNTQINFMMKNNIALSFSDYRYVNEDGTKVGRLLTGYNKIGWHLHHISRYLGCLTMVLDRQYLPDFEFSDLDPAYRAEDFYAWSNCIKQIGYAYRCPHDLARYTIGMDSRSSKKLLTAISVWSFYRKIERIKFVPSMIYFILYSFGVVDKRYWCRPIFNRASIDKNMDWSIISKKVRD